MAWASGSVLLLGANMKSWQQELKPHLESASALSKAVQHSMHTWITGNFKIIWVFFQCWKDHHSFSASAIPLMFEVQAKFRKLCVILCETSIHAVTVVTRHSGQKSRKSRRCTSAALLQNQQIMLPPSLVCGCILVFYSEINPSMFWLITCFFFCCAHWLLLFHDSSLTSSSWFLFSWLKQVWLECLTVIQADKVKRFSDIFRSLNMR